MRQPVNSNDLFSFLSKFSNKTILNRIIDTKIFVKLKSNDEKVGQTITKYWKSKQKDVDVSDLKSRCQLVFG